eukprot:4428952-Prymnesium_polylepis.1
MTLSDAEAEASDKPVDDRVEGSIEALNAAIDRVNLLEDTKQAMETTAERAARGARCRVEPAHPPVLHANAPAVLRRVVPPPSVPLARSGGDRDGRDPARTRASREEAGAADGGARRRLCRCHAQGQR